MIVDEHGNPISVDFQEAPTLAESAYADPLHLFRGQVYQYNPSILVSNKGIRIFDEIRRDDQVKAALSFKKHALLSTGWQIKSPADKPDDWEPTLFVEEQFDALEGTFKEAVIQILTALDFGYSVTEKVFDHSGTQTDLVALKTRAPHSFKFDVDEYGNLRPDGVIQENRQDTGMARLPRDKFVLLQYQEEFGNPYGRSDLDATYRSWWGKDSAFKWLMMLLERHGIPPIFALYNSARYKGSSLTDLRGVISTLQAATSGTIPRGAKDDLELWTPELAGQVSSVFMPAMKMLNEDIARSILMPGLMGLTPEQGSGSLARARVIFDVFILVVEYLRTTIEERVVNEQIIRPLVSMNFPVDEFPEFHFNPITEDSRVELLKSWAELIGAGAVLNTKDDEDHIRALLEFPEREGEDMPEMPGGSEDEPEDGPDDEPGEDEPEAPQDDDLEFADETMPTSGMVAEARRGLAWRRKFRRGGTAVGIARARSIINRVNLPQDSITRMRSFFARHEVDKKAKGWRPGEEGYPSNGRIAWALWGGDAGKKWADRLATRKETHTFQAKVVRVHQEDKPIERQKTKAEASTNFQDITSALDGIEMKATEALVAALKAAQKTMMGRLRKSGPSIAVPKVMPAQKEAIRSAVEEMVTSSVKKGMRTVRSGIPKKMQEAISADPDLALDYFDQKILWITDVLTERVIEESRQAMLASIQKGETTQQAMDRLRDVFEPYIGSGQLTREGKLLTPHRIETIVRTNTTEAFNQGRLTEIMRPEMDDIVEYVQYSAIMDTRTTPICKTLDGKVFRRDDPALQDFTPPNHYACRSVLVPLTPDIEVDQKDVVSPKLAGKARELKGKGFTEEGGR